MSDYLPNDILIDIFQRLSIKPLARCMVVCKSWYTLIASPHFVSMNLNHVYNTQFTLTSGHQHNVEPFDELRYYIPKHIIEVGYLYGPVGVSRMCEIAGNTNGLICLSIDLFPSDPIVIFWNPTIHKILELPKPNLSFSSNGRLYTQSFGFGYDHISNDFKLVRIVQLKDKMAKLVPPRTKEKVVPPIIELYKLSTGEWQVLSHVILPFRIDGASFYVCLNGNLHWVAYGEENKDAIVLFNLSSDEFGLMMLPDYILILGKIKEVDVYRGSLSLIVFQYDQNTSMWVMGSYGDVHSWSKIRQFQSNTMLFSVPSGEEIEALITDYQFSVSVDRKDMKVKLLQSPCSENKGIYFSTSLLCLNKGLPTIRLQILLSAKYPKTYYMDAFFESLALLDKGIPLCDSVTCNILPREHETEKVMEQVTNDSKSQSLKCRAKKKNAKLSECFASLIKKHFLCS